MYNDCYDRGGQMNPIITGLDIGNSAIKVVVATFINDDLHIIATTSIKSQGLKKNKIYDEKKAKEALRLALLKTEEKLGMKIKEVILCVPANTAQMTIESGLVSVNEVVEGQDVSRVLKDAAEGTYDSSRELVTVLPISFTVDDKASVLDPKKELGKKLFTKAVVATSPKEEIYPFINLVRSVGINILDIVYNTQADYYTVASKEIDRKMGCLINLGADVTTISIFNKGIMIKNSFLPVGSSSVSKDISFIYKIDMALATKLKETFALTVGRYADSNDSVSVITKEGHHKQIEQTEISEIIESRVSEILKLAKNEINRLTKREISYIIVVGGISELAGFNYLVEEILGQHASCYNMQILGARHNQYTSALGACKYFHKKCEERDIVTSMFGEEEQQVFSSPKRKNTVNDTMLNKFFGHFFDN